MDQTVKAMILNGLGCTNHRLCFTPHFFQNKSTERLLGRSIIPEYLHNDTLGEALNAPHAFGVSELFSLIAQQAVKRLRFSPK